MYHARIYMLPCYLTTLYLTGKICQGHLKRNDCYSWLHSCAQVFESVASMSPAHLLLIAYWLADSGTPTQHSRGTTYSILHWPGNIKTHQAKTSMQDSQGTWLFLVHTGYTKHWAENTTHTYTLRGNIKRIHNYAKTYVWVSTLSQPHFNEWLIHAFSASHC